MAHTTTTAIITPRLTGAESGQDAADDHRGLAGDEEPHHERRLGEGQEPDQA